MPTTDDLIANRSEEVQEAIEKLASRKSPPAEGKPDSLRLSNVFSLGLSVRCWEGVSAVRQAILRAKQPYCHVDDPESEEIIALLKQAKAGTIDSFTDELQVVIDLAYHAGFHPEVEWIINIWDDFRPLPVSQPSSA